MINIETCLIGLIITSTTTGLTTEAIKIILNELNTTYHSNTLAGIVALFVSIALGMGYVVWADVEITAQIIVYIVAHSFMSWLCAMVGYDKVIQSIKQIGLYKNE